MSGDVLRVRHILARWRANDWRRGFALAPGLEAALRKACEVPGHEPITDNTGSLAKPLLRKVSELDLEHAVQALRPLLEELAREQPDLTPGLAELAACDLVPRADATDLVRALDEAKARALAAAERALADLRADRPLDLADLLAWNERLQPVPDVAALRTASLAAETQALLADAVEKGDPEALRAVQAALSSAPD
jgi:hypothetical protein